MGTEVGARLYTHGQGTEVGFEVHRYGQGCCGRV